MKKAFVISDRIYINRVLNFADIYFHALGSTDIKSGTILSSPSNNLPNQVSLLSPLYIIVKYSSYIFHSMMIIRVFGNKDKDP